jgi:hypothetical protein
MATTNSYHDAQQGNAANLLRSAADARTGASALSDTLDLFEEAQGFLCNAAGTVIINTPNQASGKAGHTVTIVALAGVEYPIRVQRVWSTGTTVAAANLVLLKRRF